jgi:CHAT domain-containing protein
VARRHLGRVDQLIGPEATVATVLRRLDGMARLHLACHGEQDLTGSTPARIHLADGVVTIRDLARLDLAAAELAVLSACETVQGTAPLADEALTVASAIQLAGFRHVVGTLWAVPDGVAPRFADAFYRALAAAGPDRGAHALHAAVRVLRARYPRAAHAWAGYVHVGR